MLHKKTLILIFLTLIGQKVFAVEKEFQDLTIGEFIKLTEEELENYIKEFNDYMEKKEKKEIKNLKDYTKKENEMIEILEKEIKKVKEEETKIPERKILEMLTLNRNVYEKFFNKICTLEDFSNDHKKFSSKEQILIDIKMRRILLEHFEGAFQKKRSREDVMCEIMQTLKIFNLSNISPFIYNIIGSKEEIFELLATLEIGDFI